jgi:hypothetical protein
VSEAPLLSPATPGTAATDSIGRQPGVARYDKLGYLSDGVVRHPLAVA